MQDDQSRPTSPGASVTANPAFPWLVVLVVLAVLVVAAGFVGRVTADGNEPSSLLEQVTKGQRSGIVADNVRGQVCVYLIKADKTAETRKSCISTKQALNMGKSFEELPAVELKQGVGLFRITRDTRYGVSDGVLFEVIDELPLLPPAAPTIVPMLPNSGGDGK